MKVRKQFTEFTCSRCGKQEHVELLEAPEGWMSVVTSPILPIDLSNWGGIAELFKSITVNYDKKDFCSTCVASYDDWFENSN